MDSSTAISIAGPPARSRFPSGSGRQAQPGGRSFRASRYCLTARPTVSWTLQSSVGATASRTLRLKPLSVTEEAPGLTADSPLKRVGEDFVKFSTSNSSPYLHYAARSRARLKLIVAVADCSTVRPYGTARRLFHAPTEQRHTLVRLPSIRSNQSQPADLLTSHRRLEAHSEDSLLAWFESEGQAFVRGSRQEELRF